MIEDSGVPHARIMPGDVSYLPMPEPQHNPSLEDRVKTLEAEVALLKAAITPEVPHA